MRPCGSRPAPNRSVSRQVSSRKLFEPRSTTASVAAGVVDTNVVRRPSLPERMAKANRKASQQRLWRPQRFCYARRFRARAFRIEHPMPVDYLKKILTARVYDVAI